MARAPILRLPCEIHLLILENILDDLNTLAALEITCRVFQGIFNEHKPKFLNAALLEKNGFPEVLQTEAMLVQKVPTNKPEDIVAAGQGSSMMSLLRRYEAMGNVDAEVKLTDLSLRGALSIVRYHTVIIEPLAQYYVLVCSNQTYALKSLPTQVTASESTRVQRALYRFELYLRALGGSHQHRALRKYFFEHLLPTKNAYDVDQLIALQMFLRQIVRQAFNTVATRLNQRIFHEGHRRSDFLLMLGLRWSFSFSIIGVCSWPENLVERQRLSLVHAVREYQKKSRIELTSHDYKYQSKSAFLPGHSNPIMVPYKQDDDGSVLSWSRALTDVPDRHETWIRSVRPRFVEQLHAWGSVFWNEGHANQELQRRTSGWERWPAKEINVDNHMIARRAQFLKSIDRKVLAQGGWD